MFLEEERMRLDTESVMDKLVESNPEIVIGCVIERNTGEVFYTKVSSAIAHLVSAEEVQKSIRGMATATFAEVMKDYEKDLGKHRYSIVICEKAKIVEKFTEKHIYMALLKPETPESTAIKIMQNPDLV